MRSIAVDRDDRRAGRDVRELGSVVRIGEDHPGAAGAEPISIAFGPKAVNNGW